MDKEGQHIMIHGSLYKKITILNMYALNYRAPKYMSECDRTIRSTKESVITVGGTTVCCVVAIGRVSTGVIPTFLSVSFLCLLSEDHCCIL